MEQIEEKIQDREALPRRLGSVGLPVGPTSEALVPSNFLLRSMGFFCHPRELGLKRRGTIQALKEYSMTA